MKFFQIIKKIAWVDGGSSGRDFDLSQIPKVLDGQPVYVERLDIVTRLKLTNNDVGNDVDLGGYGAVEAKAVRRVRLTPNWTGFDQVNLTGLELQRIHRASHRGLRPAPAENWDKVAKGGGTKDVIAQMSIDFRSPYGRRARDTVMPAALLSTAEFVVDFGSFPGLVVSDATVEVIATCSTRGSKELTVPALMVLASQEIAAGTKQPTLARYRGNLTHVTIARAAGQMAATDFTRLGLRVGARQVTDDSAPVEVFYGDFDYITRSTGGTSVQPHTMGGGAQFLDDFIPLVADNGGLEGQRLTATLDANADQRLLTDAAVNAWVMTHRRIEHRGPWVAAAARVLGIDPGSLASQTASHKPLNPGANRASSVLPHKARARAAR